MEAETKLRPEDEGEGVDDETLPLRQRVSSQTARMTDGPFCRKALPFELRTGEMPAYTGKRNERDADADLGTLLDADGRGQDKCAKLVEASAVSEQLQTVMGAKVAEATELRGRLEELTVTIECPLCLERQATTAFDCGHCYCGSSACASSSVTECVLGGPARASALRSTLRRAHAHAFFACTDAQRAGRR
eukprot:842229-Rhodomonas_salina.1